VNAKFQFSLGQLLLTVTLAAICLGVGKWCYIEYVDRIISLTAESGVPRDKTLDSYLGKRVSFCGRYQYLGSDSPYQIVWFGRNAIALVGIRANGASQLPIPDGVWIVVTGRLAAMSPSPVVSIGPETWYDEYWVYHEANVEELVPYRINVERASIVPSAKEKQRAKAKKDGEKQMNPIISPIIGPV
jgi:hypothetical protein